MIDAMNETSIGQGVECLWNEGYHAIVYFIYACGTRVHSYPISSDIIPDSDSNKQTDSVSYHIHSLPSLSNETIIEGTGCFEGFRGVARTTGQFTKAGLTLEGLTSATRQHFSLLCMHLQPIFQVLA